ncbi:MAG: proton-conducting transporter membrane subunit [Myxococcota bacterium]
MVEWDDGLTASLIRWIVLLPLAASLLHAAMIGLLRIQLAPRTVWLLSSLAIAVSFVLSGASIFDLVGNEGHAPIVDRVGSWIGGGVGARSFSADLTLRLDPLSSVCCVVVTSIALAVYLYVYGRIQSGALAGDRVHRLFALLDLLVGSTLILLFADNLILFFFGWTGVGVASQLVSSFELESKQAARAGSTTFVVGRVGDLALLAAILLLFDGLARSGAPTLRFEGVEAAFRLLEGSQVELPRWLGGGGFPLLELVGGCLALAAVAKCAQVPLHFWLAGASQGPTSATALIHASTTMVAGCYGLLRCSFLLGHAPVAMEALVVVAATTVVVASLAAATAFDLSRLVAHTTSAALGLVLVGIGLGAPSTATFLLLSHAYTKAHWILVLGVAQAECRGESDLRRMGGLGRVMRWTHVVALVSGLTVVGVPPIGNFLALEELLAWVRALERSGVLAACLVGSAALAFAVARAHFLIFWGNPPEVTGHATSPRATAQDPVRAIQYALTALGIFAIFVGWLSPSQFWGDLVGLPKMDTVGGFFARTLAGPADPPLEGLARWRTLASLVLGLAAGITLAVFLYTRRRAATAAAPSAASSPPATALATTASRAREAAVRLGEAIAAALRETLYVEQAVGRLVVRPLRGFSRLLLAGVVEGRLLDRGVVSGGSGLARRLVWTGLRRLQNGRVQSYAVLGVIALLLSVVWLVD